MQVQIGAPGVGYQRALRVADRPVDDLQILFDDADRRRVELAPAALQGALQSGDLRGVAGVRRVGGCVDQRRRPAPHLRGSRGRRGVSPPAQQPDGSTRDQRQRNRSGRELRHREGKAPARTSRREAHDADVLRDPGPQVGRRRAVVERAGAPHHPAQLLERRAAVTAGSQVRLERGPLGSRKLAIEIFRQSISPLVLHTSLLIPPRSPVQVLP